MQEEGTLSKSEGLGDFKITAPEWEGLPKLKPKLFQKFRLDEFVPDTNIYKILRSKIDHDFIYKSTKPGYSHSRRPGLNTVVFFKMILSSYLENIPTDRGLERLFQMRLDLR